MDVPATEDRSATFSCAIPYSDEERHKAHFTWKALPSQEFISTFTDENLGKAIYEYVHNNFDDTLVEADDFYDTLEDCQESWDAYDDTCWRVVIEAERRTFVEQSNVEYYVDDFTSEVQTEYAVQLGKH